MPYFLKVISVFLLATVKYFYTPLYAFLTGLTMQESIVIMSLGGITSLLFFYYISHFIIISTRIVKPVAARVTPDPLLDRIRAYRSKRAEKRQNRRKFTRRSRMMVRLKRAGLWAVILTTPSMLSIPVGAFILRKYYHRKRYAIFLTILAIILEGILFCWIVWQSPVLQP